MKGDAYAMAAGVVPASQSPTCLVWLVPDKVMGNLHNETAGSCRGEGRYLAGTKIP